MPRLHVPLLLLALTAALTIKIAVHEGEQRIQQTVPATVVYPSEDDMVILDPIQEVEVRLEGKASDMAQLSRFNVTVQADLPLDVPGIVEVSLSPDNVRTPDEITVLGIEPNRFSLEVDRQIEKSVPVAVQVTGEPAAGARVVTREARPERVTIRGPESLLLNLDVLPITVSVERRAISFEERVAPEVPASVQIVAPLRVIVSVELQIEEVPPPP